MKKVYIVLNIIFLIWIFFLIFKKKKNKDKDDVFESFINKHYKIIVFSLFAFVILSSFINLFKITLALHVDEVGMFHDAKLIAKYGYERHLQRFPVYLINYGGGQSVLYAYIMALIIKLFGDSIYLIRLPIAIFRIISFIFIYKLVENEEDKLKRIVYLFIFANVPFFIMNAGIGLDCNLLVHFAIISVSLLINAILKKKNSYLFLSGIFFGLSLYTYALSYIILPILLLLLIIYLLYTKAINIKQIILFLIPIIALAVPLILFVLVNQGIIEEIHGVITIPKLPEYRGNELNVSNIKDIGYLLFVIIIHDRFAYNSIRYFGTIFYISIPFAIYGFLSEIDKLKESIKTKTFNYSTIILLLFISGIIPLALVDKVNVNKANILLFPVVYFVAVGIINIFNDRKNLIMSVMFTYLFMTAIFLNYYSIHTFDRFNSILFVNQDFLQTLDYIENREEENVYFDFKNYKRYVMKEYIYMKYGLSEDKYNDSINGKYYKDGMPEKLDDTSIVVSDYLIEERDFKKIGSYYITTYDKEEGRFD